MTEHAPFKDTVLPLGMITSPVYELPMDMPLLIVIACAVDAMCQWNTRVVLHMGVLNEEGDGKMSRGRAGEGGGGSPSLLAPLPPTRTFSEQFEVRCVHCKGYECGAPHDCIQRMSTNLEITRKQVVKILIHLQKKNSFSRSSPFSVPSLH